MQLQLKISLIHIAPLLSEMSYFFLMVLRIGPEEELKKYNEENYLYIIIYFLFNYYM